MKVYIAGKLETESEKKQLEEIAEICNSLGIKTFLPHRDVGICKEIKDAGRVFHGDIIEGFKDCDLLIALLDGLHVGAGTAWELGYAYAKGVPTLGIKTDEKIEDAVEYLSAILIASTPIVKSLNELKEKLREFKKKN
jgi:nucleoside 2-deoxyribosyltransferase